MNTQSAIDFINRHLAAIGSAARRNNPAALEVQAAYAQLCQHVHPVTEDALICAVEGWMHYCQQNPQAEV